MQTDFPSSRWSSIHNSLGGALNCRVFRSSITWGPCTHSNTLAETKYRDFPSRLPCSSDLTLNFTVGSSWGDAVQSAHFSQDVTVKACTPGRLAKQQADEHHGRNGRWILISSAQRAESATWTQCVLHLILQVTRIGPHLWSPLTKLAKAASWTQSTS